MIDAAMQNNIEQDGETTLALGEPLVHFSSHQYFCTEGEEDFVLRVIRTGDLSKQTVVGHKCLPASAKKGVHYKPLGDRVTFQPGDFQAEIKVEILQNESFGTCTEFRVELHVIENARLAEDLWQ